MPDELNDERFYALRAHEQANNIRAYLDRAAIDAANAAVKSLLLINGGAVVALLGFIAALAGPTPEARSSIASLASPLMWFGGGVGVAVFAGLCAYLVHFCYASASLSQDQGWKHPYVTENKASKAWLIVGRVFHILGVLAAVAALSLFATGVIGVRDSIDAFATATKP
jgi:hypothetical protein